MFIPGSAIIRMAGDSQVAKEKFFSCPWGVVKQLDHVVDANRRVADGLATLPEYVGGRPSIAAYQALELMQVEIPRARRARDSEPDEEVST